MRTFKYSYVDAKGNHKESTIEADDKNDAYIILKTMRINPDSITETEAEDISFEVISEKDLEREKRAKSRPVPRAPGQRPPAARKGPATQTADELTIEMLSPVGGEMKREQEPAPKKPAVYRPPYEMFALFCAGVALLGWAAWATARDTAFMDWPIAKGYIMRNEMRIIGMFGKEYKPDIAYRYSVNDQVYRAETFYSREKESTKGEVLRLMKVYPVGSKVYVHYDPDNPEHAYIDAVPPESTHRFSAVLGLICFSAATAMFVLAKLNETPKPKAKPKPKTSPSDRKEPEIVISPWQQKG